MSNVDRSIDVDFSICVFVWCCVSVLSTTTISMIIEGLSAVKMCNIKYGNIAIFVRGGSLTAAHSLP